MCVCVCLCVRADEDDARGRGGGRMGVGGGGGAEGSAAADEAVTREKRESQRDQSGGSTQEASLTWLRPLRAIRRSDG